MWELGYGMRRATRPSNDMEKNRAMGGPHGGSKVNKAQEDAEKAGQESKASYKKAG